jgi:hypothetical protein
MRRYTEAGRTFCAAGEFGMYEHDVLECIVLECTVGAGLDGFVSKVEAPVLFLYSCLTEKVLDTIATGGISSTGLVLAKAVGAVTFATSSLDSKLELVKESVKTFHGGGE